MPHDFVVSLDLDDTLIIDNRLERTVALARLETLASEYDARYDRAAAEFVIDEFLSRDRDSDRDTDTFIGWFYERFARAGRAAVNAAKEYRDAVVAAAAVHVVAIPGARETLAELDRLTIPCAARGEGALDRLSRSGLCKRAHRCTKARARSLRCPARTF
jgi:hypothetical protein